MNASSLKQLTCILLLFLAFATRIKAADDNLLAHRLYTQGDYAQAAEIFTEPAWKGLALYRSSQWWRAAEAFIRADDAISAYNLGNCYVELGYYALALEAYQRALSIEPLLEDAAHNADIMRQLLANDESGDERSGRQSNANEIERLDSENPEDASQGEGGEQQSDQGENTPGESRDDGTQSMGSEQDAQTGLGGETTEDNQRPDDPQGEGNSAIDGQAAEPDQQTGRPSGGSETTEPLADSAAAGVRSTLETEQATIQWLNRIQHNPKEFLQKRLKLEQERRRTAGQSAPQGGSTW